MTASSLPCCAAVLLIAAAVSPVAYGQAAPPADEKAEAKEKGALDEAPVKLDPVPTDAIPGGTAPKAPAPAPVSPLNTDIPALAKLTPEQKQNVAKGLGEVASYMRGVRLQESLEKLNEVEAITGDFHIVANMRGAIYTKMGILKSARTEFEKAAKMTEGQPREHFHPRFNLAEIDFVEKKWAESRKAFSELLAKGEVPDTGTRRLMEYKILICALQEKQFDQAKEMAAKFDPYDHDSPAYYFSMAAAAFAQDKKEEAEEWLGSAAKIYPKELNDVYQDSLVEVGWLQTLR